jgi:hypothetical protein
MACFHDLLLAARRPVTRRRVRVGALRIGGFMPFDIELSRSASTGVLGAGTRGRGPRDLA